MTQKQVEFLRLRLRPAVEGHVFLNYADNEHVPIIEVFDRAGKTYLKDADGDEWPSSDVNWSSLVICDPVPNARRIQ